MIKLLTGDTAWTVVMVLATICSVMERIEANRNGTSVGFMPMGGVYIILAVWAIILECKKKKQKKNV